VGVFSLGFIAKAVARWAQPLAAKAPVMWARQDYVNVCEANETRKLKESQANEELLAEALAVLGRKRKRRANTVQRTVI